MHDRLTNHASYWKHLIPERGSPHRVACSGMDVNLDPKPPETILPGPPPQLLERLEQAETVEEISAAVADHPDELFAWAALGEALYGDGGSVEANVRAYSAFRVGYHRGLDSLRKNGWRGSGYVRWRHPSNRGFLRCLDGLARTAEAIGEISERDRCEEFLGMLDPNREWRHEVRES